MAKIHTERGALVLEALRLMEAVIPPGEWRELAHDRILEMDSDHLKNVIETGYKFFESWDGERKRRVH